MLVVFSAFDPSQLPLSFARKEAIDSPPPLWGCFQREERERDDSVQLLVFSARNGARSLGLFEVCILQIHPHCRGEMIQLLFLVLFAEGAVALLLMVKIGPLRELAMKWLDQLKNGKGPATVKTLACTLSMIMASSIFSIVKIQNRGAKLGTLTPMDQVLWRTHLLEASLIGYMLFLAFVIDRLHHYLRKMSTLRKTSISSKEKVEKLQKDCLRFKEKEDRDSGELKNLREEVGGLKEKLLKLKSDSEEQEKRAVSAESHVAALQKQSEELLLEYDRLLEDNQILQTQALAFRG